MMRMQLGAAERDGKGHSEFSYSSAQKERDEISPVMFVMNEERMMRISFAPALALCLALPAMTSPASAQSALPPIISADSKMPVLTLQAQGEVESAPDMAMINSGVQTRATTAREAMAQNAAQMAKLVAAMRKAGITVKDIQTSSINLNAEYDHSMARNGQPPRFIGYQASNQVNIRVKDLKRLGPVIDQLVAAGANNLNGPTFGITDDSTLIRQAREKALQSARERAEFYAAQSGYKGVRLLSISEQDARYRPMPRAMSMAMAEEAANTVVEPGQLSTTVGLIVQYVME